MIHVEIINGNSCVKLKPKMTKLQTLGAMSGVVKPGLRHNPFGTFDDKILC